MMEKISQRTPDDCSICVVAMVMGPPYTYEKVSQDSQKYPRTDGKGKYLPWWRDYLRDEGFEVELRPLLDPKRFSDLASLPENSRAMLVFHIPPNTGHIVAIDREGVIDPRDDADRRTVRDFSEIFHIEGWKLYSDHFWLVRRP